MDPLRVCIACHKLSRVAGVYCPSCGAPLPSDTAELIDGRYRCVREIGRGAMGTVMLAEDVALQRRVAIKLAGGDDVTDPALTDRFYAEAAALATVRHDHVALVHAFGLHGDRPFFAMEFVQGSSLAHLLRERAAVGDRVPVFRIVSIVRDVALGLAAVHAAGVIHCDVKPPNVVIESRTGRAVLVDFGIAVRQGPGARTGSTPSGTPAYMAPEQIIPDSAIVPQTDLYALACTLYELLTGHVPFDGENFAALWTAHLLREPPTLAAVDPAWSVIDPLLKRALAREPSMRFESALSFAHALDALLPTFTPTRLSLPPPALSVPPARERPTRALARVMVVDDDPPFSKLAGLAVKSLFKPDELDLVVAHDGAEALSLAPVAPRLMVLDQNMPGLTGTDVLAQLRERPGGGTMRVLVCSAGADERALARFRLLGVTDFLPKPMAFRALVAALRELAESAGLLVRQGDEG